MDIEIRRNRDISFNVTCENPESLKELFQMTDDQKRQQERFETWSRQVEDEFWRFVKEHPTKDCNGELIKPETHEIGFDLIPAIVNNGEIVSSSLIRNCIRDGQMEKADSLLGRPFSISGRIRHGRSIGSKIGFPTINLKMPDGITVPSFGVYATNTLINGYKLCSITNVGTRPTFNSESDISVETNIFNYSGDLYGDFCEVFFYKKIRDEKRFSSPELLSFQIAEDVKTVNEFFSKK